MSVNPSETCRHVSALDAVPEPGVPGKPPLVRRAKNPAAAITTAAAPATAGSQRFTGDEDRIRGGGASPSTAGRPAAGVDAGGGPGGVGASWVDVATATCQTTIAAVTARTGPPMRIIHSPHPISGPMDLPMNSVARDDTSWALNRPITKASTPASPATAPRAIIRLDRTSVRPKFNTANRANVAIIPRISVMVPSLPAPRAFLLIPRKAIHGPTLPAATAMLAISAAIKLGQ